MDVSVDDKVVDDVRKRRERLVSVESVVQWLTDRMLLPPRESGGPQRVLLSGSPMPDVRKKTAFRLYGAGFAVDIACGTDDLLRVTRVVEARRAVEGNERRPIYLATGSISFRDVTVAGQFRGMARTEIDRLVAQADSYLGLWQAYNDKEKEQRSCGGHESSDGWATPAESSVPTELGGSKSTSRTRRSTTSGDGFRRLTARRFRLMTKVPAAIQGKDNEGPLNGTRRPFTGELVTRRSTPPSLSLRPPSDQDDRRPPAEGFSSSALLETRSASSGARRPGSGSEAARTRCLS